MGAGRACPGYGAPGIVYEVILGGLDPRPIHIGMETPLPKAGEKAFTLKVLLTNRMKEEQKVTVEYRVYDADSFMKASGQANPKPVVCPPGKTTEISCTIKDIPTLADNTVKIISVFEDGRRVIGLFSVPP